MKALIFDTETTSLIANSLINENFQPKIIEFCGQIIDDEGKLIAEEDFLVHPGKQLDPVVTKITGLTDEDLQHCPVWSFSAERVRKFIEGADAIVAHNLAYDYAVVDGEMRRCGIEVQWPIRRICTVQETEWYKGYRLSLTDLHTELFGEGFEAAHRARNDVAALKRCYLELRKRGEL